MQLWSASLSTHGSYCETSRGNNLPCGITCKVRLRTRRSRSSPASRNGGEKCAWSNSRFRSSLSTQVIRASNGESRAAATSGRPNSRSAAFVNAPSFRTRALFRNVRRSHAAASSARVGFLMRNCSRASLTASGWRAACRSAGVPFVHTSPDQSPPQVPERPLLLGVLAELCLAGPDSDERRPAETDRLVDRRADFEKHDVAIVVLHNVRFDAYMGPQPRHKPRKQRLIALGLRRVRIEARSDDIV